MNQCIFLIISKSDFFQKGGNLMEIYGSNHFFTENLNGPYGPYEHILQDRSSKYWPKNRVFDENWKFRVPKNWKMTFAAKNQTFETVPSSKMISKYILDYSRVILTQFPYVKIVLLVKSMEIDKQLWKSTKFIYKNACLGSPAGVIELFLKSREFGRLGVGSPDRGLNRENNVSASPVWV